MQNITRSIKLSFLLRTCSPYLLRTCIYTTRLHKCSVKHICLHWIHRWHFILQAYLHGIGWKTASPCCTSTTCLHQPFKMQTVIAETFPAFTSLFSTKSMLTRLVTAFTSPYGTQTAFVGRKHCLLNLLQPSPAVGNENSACWSSTSLHYLLAMQIEITMHVHYKPSPPFTEGKYHLLWLYHPSSAFAWWNLSLRNLCKPSRAL